jgi:hypothetical protein
LVDNGYAPSSAQLGEVFQLDHESIVRALRELEDGHGVVLHPHAPEIWVAHPFATAPTAFAVWQEERRWWGNCAWCSLGIAALLGGDAIEIHSTLGAEGIPVVLHVNEHRIREQLYVHFPVPMSRAWDNVHFTCATMLLFEDEREIDAWSARHGLPRGDAQPIQRVYDFARIWYGRHLDEDWRKWTLEEARGIFDRFGFRGPIWDLPRSTGRF